MAFDREHLRTQAQLCVLPETYDADTALHDSVDLVEKGLP